VAEREASGDFDYLWDDPTDEDGLTGHDHDLQAQQAEELDHPPSDPGADLWDEPDDNFWDNQPEVRDVEDTGPFDAFNVNTWNFKPAPTPWYRTRQAATVIVAASAAVAAIVVSGVLLVFRGQSETVNEVTSSVTPTAPTSAAPVQVASSEAPSPPAPSPPAPSPPSPSPPASSPPPPPPPPAETVASPVNPAPNYQAPRVQPRQTKGPEINVTRAPISVAPQQRGPR
jgi:hypothetical protein